MREHEGNCVKYLKKGWNRKEGRGNKNFKKRGQAGSRGGCLKSLKTMGVGVGGVGGGFQGKVKYLNNCTEVCRLKKCNISQLFHLFLDF